MTKCHTGTVDLCQVTLGEKTLILSGGGHSKDVDFSVADLVFDLARSTAAMSSTVTMNKEAAADKNLSRLGAKSTPFIFISWPDYGIPSLNKAFWKEALSVIKKFVKNHEKDTVRATFCCQGGHGRTGTALAIIAYKLGAVLTGESPVAFVRENYCPNAIESNSQIGYIEKICGLTLTDEARGSTWYPKNKKDGAKPNTFPGPKTTNAYGQTVRQDPAPGTTPNSTSVTHTRTHKIKTASNERRSELLRDNDYSSNVKPDWQHEYSAYCICGACLGWAQKLKKDWEDLHKVSPINGIDLSNLTIPAIKQASPAVPVLPAAPVTIKARPAFSRRHELIFEGPQVRAQKLVNSNFLQYYSPAWQSEYHLSCCCNKCMGYTQHLRLVAKEITKKNAEAKRRSVPAPAIARGRTPLHEREISILKTGDADEATSRSIVRMNIDSISHDAEDEKRVDGNAKSQGSIAAMITRRIEA